MSVTKNILKLNDVYDLVKSGFISYSPANDPRTTFLVGLNSSGELANNSTTSTSSPVLLPGSWINVNGYASGNFTGIRCDNSLFTWGNNCGGAMGVNTDGNLTCLYYSSPVQVPGKWIRSSMGCWTGGGICRLGTLYLWGHNQYGNLGVNDVVCRSEPVQVPGTTWCALALHSKQTKALKTDGTLWGWGYGGFGHGDGTGNTYSSPVQVPGTTWRSVSASYSHTLATKTDGTLWAWGDNREGMLGDISQTARNSPVQIPGTNWTSVQAAYYWSSAVKSDGTLWVWGCNFNGGLGLGGAPSNWCWKSSPTQVPGTTWRQTGGSGFSGLFTKTDGTLWNTGTYYGIGITYSSPIQLAGTWYDVCGTNTFAVRCC